MPPSLLFLAVPSLTLQDRIIYAKRENSPVLGTIWLQTILEIRKQIPISFIRTSVTSVTSVTSITNGHTMSCEGSLYLHPYTCLLSYA